MMNMTFDEVFEKALSLPLADQRRLVFTLSTSPAFETRNGDEYLTPRERLERVVIAQGKRPLNFAELRKLGEFFPNDEDVDDLVNAVREWRRDKRERSIE
ncbi:MAG TPA: hypothetical protein VJ810_24685 [Blastocatellia bacterium]|nr:hypothetical protein [Blastocatellia bacterium]